MHVFAFWNSFNVNQLYKVVLETAYGKVYLKTEYQRTPRQKFKKSLSELANNNSNNKKNQDCYNSHGDYPVGSHPKEGGQRDIPGGCEWPRDELPTRHPPQRLYTPINESLALYQSIMRVLNSLSLSM